MIDGGEEEGKRVDEMEVAPTSYTLEICDVVIRVRETRFHTNRKKKRVFAIITIDGGETYQHDEMR